MSLSHKSNVKWKYYDKIEQSKYATGFTIRLGGSVQIGSQIGGHREAEEAGGHNKEM